MVSLIFQVWSARVFRLRFPTINSPILEADLIATNVRRVEQREVLHFLGGDFYGARTRSQRAFWQRYMGRFTTY